MANVITVKRRKKTMINRNPRGEGIVRIDSEAADILEKFLSEAGAGLSVKDLASSLIKYAANDTVIKVCDYEEDEE